MYATCLWRERDKQAVLETATQVCQEWRNVATYDEALELGASGRAGCVVLDLSRFTIELARQAVAALSRGPGFVLHVVHQLEPASRRALAILAKCHPLVRDCYRPFHDIRTQLGALSDSAPTATLALLAEHTSRCGVEASELLVALTVLGERPVSVEMLASVLAVPVSGVRPLLQASGLPEFTAVAGLIRCAHAAYRRDRLLMRATDVALLGGWSGSSKAMGKFVRRVSRTFGVEAARFKSFATLTDLVCTTYTR